MYSGKRLSIQSIEEKTERAIVIHLHSALDADRTKIEEQAKKVYEEKLNEVEENKDGLNFLMNNHGRLERNLHNESRLEDMVSELAHTQIFKTYIYASDNAHVNVQLTAIQKQELYEVAGEIKQVLEDISKKHPAITTTERMNLAAEVMKTIENNQTLSKRVFNALKVGGIASLKEVLKHPAAVFIINALEDFIKTGSGR